MKARMLKIIAMTCAAGLMVVSTQSFARNKELPELKVPSTLNQLQNVEYGEAPPSATKIRSEAQREAAISFGARGGLARRTWEIRQQLAAYEDSMSETFNFRRLLINAPSGLLIEPPVVTEAMQAMLIEDGGQQAAVADRILKIQKEAKIVSAPRDWRVYLERDWGEVQLPPAILMPRDDEERAAWVKWVAEGWELGIEQAEETFEVDLWRLTRDFSGMVRYRELVAQNMITAPYAMYENRGVSGGGNMMRVGDRGVKITGPARLETQSERWVVTPLSTHPMSKR